MTKRPQENKIHPFIIIGGGASGLAAACIAAENNTPALLIEKNNKLGKKLLATGNGRCNILNSGDPLYFGDADFANKALKRCNLQRLVSFLKSLGLVLRQEDGGRIYPAANRSDAVLKCIENKIKNSSVAIHLEETLIKINPKDGLWEVKTDRGAYLCKCLLMALGSCASPKLGGNEKAADALLPLGFKMQPWRPALCPINCSLGKFKRLKGLRVLARCTLAEIDKTGKILRASSLGEVLFTDYGLSGVCIMQLSCFIEPNKTYEIYLDLSPSLKKHPPEMKLIAPQDIDKNTCSMERFLKKRAEFLHADEILLGALPNNLAKLLTAQSIKQTAKNLTQLRFPVNGARGFEFAQAAIGGIDTKDVDPATMQSFYDNLYLAGEMLNVCGDCGGFNLMFAFASGILAAEDAAKRL